MFARQTRKHIPVIQPKSPWLLIVGAEQNDVSDEQHEAIAQAIPDARGYAMRFVSEVRPDKRLEADFLLSLFVDPEQLDDMTDAMLAARGAGCSTTLIVAVRGSQLLALGRWLEKRAEAGRLAGMRLILAHDVQGVVKQLPERLTPVIEDNVIRMPYATGIENSGFKNFYVFSPQQQALVARVRGFAENGVERAYLLGGPGSGKTSLAYYYYLVRERGRFITVNLAAENTGDKAAIKSLLCGHVTGAFPGAGARSGAFLLADDGLCFIDESHGVIGPVMEVLMEALDNNQYLPLGAAAKQPLRCAILFATNRSWQHLQDSVNIDEFTRIGASTLELAEVHRRQEDLIAVVATTLARLAKPCTTWTPPQGLSPAAWNRVRDCRWHGNVRAVIRTLESAFVDTATSGSGGRLIQPEAIEQGIERWEPETHHSHKIYAAHED